MMRISPRTAGCTALHRVFACVDRSFVGRLISCRAPLRLCVDGLARWMLAGRICVSGVTVQRILCPGTGASSHTAAKIASASPPCDFPDNLPFEFFAARYRTVPFDACFPAYSSIKDNQLQCFSFFLRNDSDRIHLYFRIESLLLSF